MNIDDAMKIDSERGGRGEATHPFWSALSMNESGYLGFRDADLGRITPKMAREIASNDWEPVTPEPEPTCEWCGLPKSQPYPENRRGTKICNVWSSEHKRCCTRKPGHTDGRHARCIGMDHPHTVWHSKPKPEPEPCASCEALKERIQDFKEQVGRLMDRD